ncbi:MAG: PilZ domain-containing protein [Gammaproteobacteria bacterium]
MENRNHVRLVSAMTVVLYVDGHGRHKGVLQDVSQGGVAVSLLQRGEDCFNTGDAIFMLADNMDEAFTMEIVRVDGDVIGLRFIE